ncbi:MAG TPA: DUF202 domain-containing protein [Gemmatimonadaceae bacterium]|nr:DUF202 domain-containing protein [Gemmatimonadaceae bacterium]
MPPPLPLRDELALDRTVLANERTLLSYARTALGLLGAGAAALQLFESEVVSILGWSFIVIAAAVTIVGIAGYLRMREKIRRAREMGEGETTGPGSGIGGQGPEAG